LVHCWTLCHTGSDVEAQSGDRNFVPPTQDAWVTFQGDMVTCYYFEE
jgi:hypothetical protein